MAAPRQGGEGEDGGEGKRRAGGDEVSSEERDGGKSAATVSANEVESCSTWIRILRGGGGLGAGAAGGG
eukprot:53260-Hanusia_phi.AAC.1